MKVFILFVLITLVLQAGSIEDFAADNGYEVSYEKALEKAKNEKKPIMLVMVTHYCPWCRKYEKNTLTKKSIKTLVSKKYVPLILNRSQQQFPKKFDTPRIPTTFFIDAKDERLIYSEMGFKTKSEFIDMEKRVGR